VRYLLCQQRDSSVFIQMARALGCTDEEEPVGAMLTQLAGATFLPIGKMQEGASLSRSKERRLIVASAPSGAGHRFH
jgi:hypothetical protein